jgi:nucleoside-diphosphate-sugar epimerase
MGASIFDVTLKYDELALCYLRQHPECRYIFLSSGAVYGSSFDVPADENAKATLAINDFKPHDYYLIAKLHAECRHRSLPFLQIIDLRIFNYFSQSSDIEARFLITDILRSIRLGKLFQTSQENIIRDYIGPKDFSQIIKRVLTGPSHNVAVDCFTQKPVDKISLLERMRTDIGLQYSIVRHDTGLSVTGRKLNYYSKSRKATDLFGYVPESGSLDLIMEQSRLLLARL